MDHTDLRTILAELRAIDPGLPTDDVELLRCLEQFLASRPMVRLDPAFIARLNAVLRQKMIEQQSTQSKKAFLSYFNFFHMNNKTWYALGGVAALAIVLVAVTRIGTPSPVGAPGTVRLLASNAFGTLTANVPGQQPLSDGDYAALGTREAMSGPLGLGGGAGIATSAIVPTMAVDLPVDAKIMAGSAPSTMIVRPGYYGYRYVYKGEVLSLADTEVTVYRRARDPQGALALGGDNPLGLLNLSSFPGSKLQNFQVYQDQSEGYSLNVDVENGTISINQYWPGWNKCGVDGRCPELPSLTQADVPSDEAMIAITNSFLNAHGIPTTGYAKPEVQREQPIYTIMTEPGATMPAVDLPQYVPDTFLITYPELIAGQTAYEYGSTKAGLKINVNIRDKKVVSLWDLKRTAFEGSLYASETDFAQLVKIAEQTGWAAPEAEGKAAEVQLGTPQLVLTKVWQSDPANSAKQQELFVPAYSFPVLNAEALGGYFGQNAVIVPLVKDLLDAYGNQPQPMPLMKADLVRPTEPAIEPQGAPMPIEKK